MAQYHFKLTAPNGTELNLCATAVSEQEAIWKIKSWLSNEAAKSAKFELTLAVSNQSLLSSNRKHHACYCGVAGVEVCDFCSGLRQHCGDVSCEYCNA